MSFRFWRKKWDREICSFELQEYGAADKPGWATVSKPSGEVPKKEDCIDLFKPGCHYRVMAKSIETSRFVGVVWNHYEPLPGGIEAKPEKEKPPPTPREHARSLTPGEWMGAYAKQVADTLEPLSELIEAVRGLDLFGGGGAPQSGNPPQQFPPLDFSGKAPWVLHPYIVREIGNQIKEVGDHIFDRLSRLPEEAAKRMQAQAEAGETVAEEEEMPLLPNAEQYVEVEEHVEEPMGEPETVPSLTTPAKPATKRRRKGES